MGDCPSGLNDDKSLLNYVSLILYVLCMCGLLHVDYLLSLLKHENEWRRWDLPVFEYLGVLKEDAGDLCWS